MNYQHYPVCTHKKKSCVHLHITYVCFSAFFPIILVKLYSVYFTLHLYILFSVVFNDFGLNTLVGSQQASCQSYNWVDWCESCHLEGPLEQLPRGCITENFRTDYILQKTYWLDCRSEIRFCLFFELCIREFSFMLLFSLIIICSCVKKWNTFIPTAQELL